MVVAVNIRVDFNQADPIVDLWDTFGEFEECPSMRALEQNPLILYRFDIRMMQSS